MPMAKDVLFVPGRIPAIPSRTVARAARRFRNAPRPCPRLAQPPPLLGLQNAVLLISHLSL